MLSAADKLDTLTVAFALGHRPTGSRDPYGLRRAAIGLCRLAVEGGRRDPARAAGDRTCASSSRSGSRAARRAGGVHARGSAFRGEWHQGVADRARLLALLEPERLAMIHEVYVRSARLAKGAPAAWEQAMLEDDAEKALGQALDSARPTLIGEDLAAAVTEAERLAPVINRFFEEVMVMHENEQLKHNRLGLLADVRDTVGALGDFSEIPV